VSGLHLIGHGLDAIIFRTRVRRTGFIGSLLDRFRPLPPDPRLPIDGPSAEDRDTRYQLAREWVDAPGMEHFALRRDVGQHFQAAWKRGHWPNLRTVAAARAMFAGFRS
jgi:hypothetical protein